MGGVPFMTWKLPTSASPYDDTDSDSTFYEPEDKDVNESINAVSCTNSNSSDLVFEGNTEPTEKENHSFCLNKDMNFKYSQELPRKCFNTKHQSSLRNPIDNKTGKLISSNYLEKNNGMDQLNHSDNLTSTTLNSSSSDKDYNNTTVDTIFTDTPNIKETLNFNDYKNHNTGEDINSIMTELVSLLQNGVLQEEDCNNYHSSTGTSSITDPSSEQRKDTVSGLVCCNLQSSFNDGLAAEDEYSMIVEATSDNNFTVPNNSTEQNIQNCYSNLLSDNHMLKEVNNGLHSSNLEFSMTSEENSLIPANTDDLLSNFDSEVFSAYDKNINFMLKNDYFHDILKHHDFQGGFKIIEDVKKRKWPNPKQWPKTRKPKSISCKSAERTLPQRNCQSKWTRNNRKMCKNEDFIELSLKKRKGKQVEVNVQKQQLSSNNYITRNSNQHCKTGLPQNVKRLENENHSFKSIEDIKYLEKVKVALSALSFHIEKWTSGQDEHPPTRSAAINMLQYVERVHINLKDKAKQCGYRKGKTHFLRVIKDAEQLILKIKNAIIEADRLYQLEQEKLLETTDDSFETILSGCISRLDNNNRPESDGVTSSWLTDTKQAQFTNENTSMIKIPDRPEVNRTNKSMNRKEWVANENDEHMSGLFCHRNSPFKASNNINTSAKKSILKTTSKGTKKYKKERKILSFSDVVKYIPEEVIYINSSDDFSDECENMSEVNQRKEINKNIDTDKTEFSIDDNNQDILKNVNTIQKQDYNQNNTYMTETSINNFSLGEVEDITLQKQVHVNGRISNQHNITENSNVKLHDFSFNVNQNKKQDCVKKHNSENYLSNDNYRDNYNVKVRSINNNNVTKNESRMTSLQSNGLGLVKHRKQVSTQNGVITEVETDMSFRQFQHTNLDQQQNNKNKMNKFNSNCNELKDDNLIKIADNNSIDDSDFVESKCIENHDKCTSKVKISPVKRKGVKKRLNVVHNNSKSNDTIVRKSGYNNKVQATVLQNANVQSLSNIQSVENKDELESQQYVNNSSLGNNAHLKQIVSFTENMITDKQEQYNMNASALTEKAQTNITKGIIIKDFIQNNITHKQNQINEESMEIDKIQSNRTLPLKQPVLTDMKREKINLGKQQIKASVVYNLKSATSYATSNKCLESPNSSISKRDTIMNRGTEKQKIICTQMPEANKFTPLSGTRYIKVTKCNETQSTSNANQTKLNSDVHNENKFITTHDNTTATQKLINNTLNGTKENPCTEQNINCQKDQLIVQSIPDQFMNMKISNGPQEEDNTSESQQITLNSEFTFDDVHHCDVDNIVAINNTSNGEKSNSDCWTITIMDVKRVRIKNKIEHIPNSEIIFDSEELFKDLNMW